MDNTAVGRRQGSTYRSSRGCWTCRLRRKKCDEIRPVCGACGTLQITCNYSEEKPDWMDGGTKQEAKVEQLKRNVKEQAHRRRGERMVQYSADSSRSHESSVEANAQPNSLFRSTPDRNASQPKSDSKMLTMHMSMSEDRIFSPNETTLLTFYLEHLLPFMFPFYQPTLLQGGKSWVLDMMLNHPMIRQAALCQSSYFFQLVRGQASSNDQVWETVLMQTMESFEMLRKSLQVFHDSGIEFHMQDAVRLMASIMQVQRFEIAVLSFNNCKVHLNAALNLFRQLFANPEAPGREARGSAQFHAIMDRLGPAVSILPAPSIQLPSAEQTAFRFSCTILLFDDIIASTVTQEQPQLYDHHRGLLCSIEGSHPLINLEAMVGCQNWALVLIAEIAVLDAWKQHSKRAGNLDVMELVHRATAIKDLLGAHLMQLEKGPIMPITDDGSSPMDIFPSEHESRREKSTRQNSLVTRIWAHAALLYLFVVVSGWQPASADVRYHVRQIMQLLAHQLSPPALLRTMVWPFCVAGCLAEPAQEAYLRNMVESLQPPGVFGTLRKALEIMENVWCERNVGNAASRDLATCFRSQGDLILLV